MVSAEVLRWNHPLVWDSEEEQYSVTSWGRPEMLLATDAGVHRGDGSRMQQSFRSCSGSSQGVWRLRSPERFIVGSRHMNQICASAVFVYAAGVVEKLRS